MPAHKKRYCVKGHDTSVVGRATGGGCRECSRLKARSTKRKFGGFEDREAYLQYQRDYHKKNGREKRLRNTFGISLADYEQILTKQHGVCAICFRPETTIHGSSKKLQSLSIDHDHKTGKVRALLCSNCNTALGLLDESCERAQSLIRYLESFNGGMD